MADEKTSAIAVRELPEPVTRRGITEPQWLTLCNNLFPGADPKSVLMVWDYCAARKLDPMKKPCHIVPMNIKDARTGNWDWRDVVMPGIYEFRTTAHRTGDYLGHSKPEYGPTVKHLEVSAPEWCDITIYRLVRGNRVEFPVRCYFREVVVTKKPKKGDEAQGIVVNERWTRAPIQMMTKCTEAAGLREAFPEELGGEHTDDEMSGRVIDVTAQHVVEKSPAQIALDRLPEGVRTNLEMACARLNFSPAQSLVKINEYLVGASDPDDGAEKLLAWLETQTTKSRAKPKGDENGKTAPQPPTQAAPQVGGGSIRGTEPDYASGDGEGVRGGSSAASGSAPVPSAAVAVTPPPSAAEVFGSKPGDRDLGF